MNRTRYHISLTVVRILAVLSLGGCCACSADTADAASAGAVRSMVCVGGEGLADGREIAILDDGGFVVAGSFNGQVVFGPGEADETALTAISEADDVFIARYRPDGTLAWVKWVFGEGKESVSGLAVKKDGSILVTGGFGSFNNPAGTIAVFGYGEANETVLAILDSPEIFVAEYGADGGLLWASQSHGKRGKASLAISEGKGGTALVTGGFRGVMTLGSGDPKETRLATYTYTSNLFVAGYESQGALAWAFDLGSLESESGRDIHGFQDGSYNQSKR